LRQKLGRDLLPFTARPLKDGRFAVFTTHTRIRWCTLPCESAPARDFTFSDSIGEKCGL